MSEENPKSDSWHPQKRYGAPIMISSAAIATLIGGFQLIIQPRSDKELDRLERRVESLERDCFRFKSMAELDKHKGESSPLDHTTDNALTASLPGSQEPEQQR